MTTETITISKEDYEEMQQELLWLQALEDAGVDNWEGFDEAREIYQEYLREGA